METIKCSAFIIPNQAFLGYVANGDHSMNQTEEVGIFIELWFHNEKSDNIMAHSEYQIHDHIVNLELLKDKKEGGTFKLRRKGLDGEDYELEVTLQQKGYRYARFGSIENVLDQITKEPNWVMNLRDKFTETELIELWNKLK